MFVSVLVFLLHTCSAYANPSGSAGAQEHLHRHRHRRAQHLRNAEPTDQTPAPTPSATGSLSTLSANNLGGLGPHDGKKPVWWKSDEGMVFEDVVRLDPASMLVPNEKVDYISINMIVRNDSAYYTSDSSKNGVRNGVGYINVMSGMPVILNFSFHSALTGAPVWLDEFRLTIGDIDMAPMVRETFTAFDPQPDEYYVTSDTTVLATKTPLRNGLKFSAQCLDGKHNNPYDLTLLSTEQLANTVGLSYTNVHSFKIIVNNEILDGNVTTENETIKDRMTDRELLQTQATWGRRRRWTGVSSRNLIFGSTSAIFQQAKPDTGSSIKAIGFNPENFPKANMMKQAKKMQTKLDKECDPDYYDGSGVKDVPKLSYKGDTGDAGAGANGPHEAPSTYGVSATSAEAVENGAYECASEWDHGWADCPECTLSRDCSCPGGFVRFGYTPHWTAWMPVSGTIQCDTATFGDPYVDHGKFCECLPKQATSAALACSSKVGALWWPTTLIAVIFVTSYLIRACAAGKNREAKLKHADNAVVAAEERLALAIQSGNRDAIDAAEEELLQAKHHRYQAVVNAARQKLAHAEERGDKAAIAAAKRDLEEAQQRGQAGSHAGYGPVERSMDTALPVLRIAPMMCVVFVAIAMRASELTTYEASQSPALASKSVGLLGVERTAVSDAASMQSRLLPAWGSTNFTGLRGTEALIGFCSIALFFQVVLRYHAERDTIRAEQEEPEELDRLGNQVIRPRLNHILYRVLSVAMYVLLLLLSIWCLCLRNAYGQHGPLKVSIVCTIILSLAYFFFQLLNLVTGFLPSSRINYMQGTNDHLVFLHYVQAVARLAALNLNFAPMICTLFLGVQLAVDSIGTDVPRLLEHWMILATIAALVQTFLAMLSPFVFSSFVKTDAYQHAGGADGSLDQMVMKRTGGVFCMTAIRWAIMGYLLLVILHLGRHLYLLRSCPQGLGDLISLLALVYFVCYVLLWFAMTCGRRKPTGQPSDGNVKALRFWHQAKNYVDIICPLLAILRVSWWVSGTR